MMRGTRGSRLLAVLVLTSLAAPARADDGPAAEAAFRRGLEAMEAGRYTEGCASIAESQRLDPRPGTLFTLAECRRKEAKIATAVALYDEYLAALAQLSAPDRTRQRAREKVADEQKRALTSHVPRLVIRVPAGVDVSVRRDDVTLRPAALGMSLPVDPGEHEITFRIGAGVTQHRTITVERDEEKIVDLDAAPPAKPVTAGETLVASPGAAGEREPASGSRQRPLVYATLAVGLAGVVVGAGTGAAVLGKRSTVSSGCVDGRCTASGLDAANDGKTLGNVSTGAFVVGGAGLVAAAILLFTEPSSPKRAALRAPVRLTISEAGKRGAFARASGEW